MEKMRGNKKLKKDGTTYLLKEGYLSSDYKQTNI